MTIRTPKDAPATSQAVTDGLNPFAALSRTLQNIRRVLEENQDKVEELVRSAHRNVIFDRAGWLLHHTTPLHLITDGMAAEDISPLLEAYYRDHWNDVAAAFRDHLAAIEIDDEARATFDEALTAHGAGLYRCTIRVLFPEIERFAREHLMPASRKSFASLNEIRQATGDLGWSELQIAANGPTFLQFGAMAHHLYEKVEKQERFDEIAKSQVPNRHAAMHGLITYKSQQNSLSALIMAEFMFKMMAYLKAHQLVGLTS